MTPNRLLRSPMLLLLITLSVALLVLLVRVSLTGGALDGDRYRLVLDAPGCLAVAKLGLTVTLLANDQACQLDTAADFSLKWVYLGEGNDLRLHPDRVIAAQKVR